MSDYTKLTNFAVKDGYTTGNPAKVIKGTELDDEFNAISTAVATKVDSTDVIPIAQGGTNSTTTADARTALGLAIGTNVPSPTGAGASGTWAINITGNAATATSATTATTAANGGVTSVNGSTGAVTVLQLGVGQTWQNVTGSRSGSSTSYQNNTGKPIMFTITPVGYSGGELQVSTDNSTWVRVAYCTDYSGATNSASAIVPPNHYYRFTGPGITHWAELR